MKTMSAAMLAACAAEIVDYIGFAEFDFESGVSRVNTTESDIVYDGKTWIGVARVAQIGNIEESDELEAAGFAATLFAGDYAALALGDPFRGRRAQAWVAFRDAAGSIIGVLDYTRGRMDKMPITLGRAGKVELSTLNRWADWQRVNAARFTDAQQKARYPDDRGFEQVSQANETVVQWGPNG